MVARRAECSRLFCRKGLTGVDAGLEAGNDGGEGVADDGHDAVRQEGDAGNRHRRRHKGVFDHILTALVAFQRPNSMQEEFHP